MIIIFSILFLSVQSLIIDPINQTCIKDSQFTVDVSFIDNTSLHYFHLPPFSQSTLQLDLRHFTQIPKTSSNESCFEFKAIIVRGGSEFAIIKEKMPNISAGVNKFIIYVDRYTQLGLYFQIQSGYEAYKYMLLDSVSIRVLQENYRIPHQTSSFLFVITNLDAISLPVNRPNVDQYSGYYISKISEQLKGSQSNIISSNSYWTTFNSIAIPFIPYLSNCQGEGDKIFLSQLMENQTDCLLVPITQTIPIDQFRFGSSPKADICYSKRQCVYNQRPGVNMEFPYWLNLPQGSTVFSITKNKINHDNYQINKDFNENQLVKCVINQSKGTNSSTQYPLNVKITLQYYQVTQQIKTMITCTVSFSLYMNSSPDFQYQFELQTKPLNHTYIMLSFGFEWYVYMIVFIIIGFISNLENLVLWLFHWCVSKKQKKEFRIRIYLRVIFQIVKGTFFALIFSIILAFSITIIMNGKVFNRTLYSSQLNTTTPKVFWDYVNNQYISDYSSNLALKYRSGRMGLSFFVAGSVIVFYTSKFFIGCEKKAKQYNDYEIMGRLLKPREWNRGKFLFGTYVYICIQFFFIYFAYSTVYSQNIWTFIVLIKIIQIIMEQITLQIYEDLLPCLPLKVITQITAYMNTLSADNLYDFLFSFLIDVAITMIQKAYVPQIQNIISQKIREKIAQILKFYAHLTNDADGQIQQVESKEKQEQQQENQFILMNSQTQQVKFFNDEQVQVYKEDSQIELNITDQIKEIQSKLQYKLLNYRRHESKQNSQTFYKNNDQEEQQQIVQKSQQQIMEQASLLFQILLDNVLLLFTFLLQPFVILVYWLTYDESGVLANYGISYGVVILYLLSAVVVSIFTIINMIMIFHLLQSYLEVDFDNKISELLGRFFSRKLFWKANDQDINKQIQISFRGADHYCLSWQFFFILAIYIISMVFVILGISTMINAKYNPFKDTAISLVVMFWLIFTLTSIWVIQRLGYRFNIDGWRIFDGDSTNLNAIVDPNVKEGDIHKKQNIEQNTNHGLIFSDFSQNELIGSTLMLRRQRKKSMSKSNKKQQQLISEQSMQDNAQIGQYSQLSEESIKTKVETICKKLQQRFQDQKFNIQYFQRNKSFLKKNVQRILPLMTELPELNEYRKPSSSILNEMNANGKRQNKNYDRSVMEIMTKWRVKTDLLTQERQRKGIELEKQLSSCSFCFQSWGIYYGAGGAICLTCSRLLRDTKKQV